MLEAEPPRKSFPIGLEFNAPKTRKRGLGEAGVCESTAALRQVTRIFRWMSRLSRSGESESFGMKAMPSRPRLRGPVSRRGALAAPSVSPPFIHLRYEAQPGCLPCQSQGRLFVPSLPSVRRSSKGFAIDSVPCLLRKILLSRRTRSSAKRTIRCRRSRMWRAIAPFRRLSASTYASLALVLVAICFCVWRSAPRLVFIVAIVGAFLICVLVLLFAHRRPN